MRQPADDRARYYRQLRATVSGVFLPELTSATAIDAAALVDRILAEFIVEEEAAVDLSDRFGKEFSALLGEREVGPVSPERFHELRRLAAHAAAVDADSDDPGRRHEGWELVDVERRFLEDVDGLRRAVLAEHTSGGEPDTLTECSITRQQLTEYLRRRLPASPDVAVTALTVVPGGRSKETMLVALDKAIDLPPHVILRKDRPVGVLPTKASDEYALLRVVHAHGGVPVPEPFFADDTPEELGEGTLLVMSRVEGHKAGEFFPDLAAPTAHQDALGRQLAAALAHLHSIPLARLVETRLDTSQEVTEASLTAAVEGMAGRIGQLSGPAIVAVPLARRWLLDHIGDVVPGGAACLLQGDVGLHNTLVEGDRLTALVDWEAATVGPPARELAAAWPAATALMSWDAFTDAYVAAGGSAVAIEPRAIAYYRVFFALGACMSSRVGGDLFRTGAKRDLLTAHSGLDAHFRAQRNLARALHDALGEA
ncbi:MAG TPA: phosphotransferase family protein [Acidimicrobiales bacterium]|nr:phosphotransferase family protein [Acidimicrobiales bacterium]